MSRSLPPPEECANCGAAIPRNTKACPECGADERTGWREQSVYDGLDLPAEAFERDDDKTASRRATRVNGVPWYWWCVGIVLVVLLAIGALRWW
jgi:hypothetical protein